MVERSAPLQVNLKWGGLLVGCSLFPRGLLCAMPMRQSGPDEADRPAPLHVGLTGNIASGKSTVSKLLAERGATITDADVLARRVVEPGTAGLMAIRNYFGDDVILPDGRLDREALRRVVFHDPVARDALN